MDCKTARETLKEELEILLQGRCPAISRTGLGAFEHIGRCNEYKCLRLRQNFQKLIRDFETELLVDEEGQAPFSY